MNRALAAFELAAGTARQLPPSTLPEIVFSGRSNVGKSTLLNRLLGRKALARVSATPGKTVTINFYKVDTARFVDFPGYGYARRSDAERRRFGELTNGYFGGGRNVALVVQLLDMRHPPSADDETMLNFLRETGLPFALVLTKADKLNKTDYAARLAAFHDLLGTLPPGTPLFACSAARGEGIDELLRCIEQAAEPAATLE